jgi:hypothetical protein
VHDLIPLLTKFHFHFPNLRSQSTLTMEHKKDTIVLDHTKSPSYLRQQRGVSTSPVFSSATSTDRLAKATAAAKIARIEAALRLSGRSEASLASQGGGTLDKESDQNGDGEKHKEGDRKSVN